tara:strand:+ start:63 stop:2189 length:2127 start_codon:yes stop_codon:yes gene_type:complete
MASTNKNLIQSLRSAHDPHFKLEGRVEGLEKNIPIQIAQLHKTLSKSFGMQRKTLMRVLGLEKKLAELEASKQQSQEAEQEIEDVIEDVQDAVDETADVIDEEIPEELDNVLNDIREEEEVGDDDASNATPTTSTATKPKPKRKRLRIKKKKISGSDLKKGSSQEKVDNIESRVLDNEKKIELVKSILKTQKSDLAEKLRSLETETESESESKQQQMSSPLLESLQAIAATTESIRDTLIQKQDNDKDIMEDIRIDQEKADADKQEKGLENTKPKPLAKLGEKIAAPVVGLFGKIFNFIKTLFLGKFLMNFLDWFGNPKNQGKIQSLIKFVGDYWPALTAAVLLFGTGFGGLVSGLLTSLAAFIPKMIAAVATMNPLLAIGLGAGALVLGAKALDGDFDKNKETTEEEKTKNKEKVDKVNKMGVLSMNEGGQVPGSGNKDTVPAVLTPGEFVVTKGAVEKFGTDTLEGMNAAAGGTSKPAPMTQEQFIEASMPGMQMIMNQQNAAVDEDPEAFNGIKLELDRDGKMPNFGEFVYNQGEAEFNKGLEMIRNNEAVPPEIKEALIKKALFIRRQTLDDPNFKGEVAFDINKDIPGTAANRLFLRAQADTTSPAAMAGLSARDRALAMNRRGMNRGGLVQAFQSGGLVTGKSKMYNIKSREPNNTVISYNQEVNKDKQKSKSTGGGNEIPSFDVAPIRDPMKMTTLQIVLF